MPGMPDVPSIVLPAHTLSKSLKPQWTPAQCSGARSPQKLIRVSLTPGSSATTAVSRTCFQSAVRMDDISALSVKGGWKYHRKSSKEGICSLDRTLRLLTLRHLIRFAMSLSSAMGVARFMSIFEMPIARCRVRTAVESIHCHRFAVCRYQEPPLPAQAGCLNSHSPPERGDCSYCRQFAGG